MKRLLSALLVCVLALEAVPALAQSKPKPPKLFLYYLQAGETTPQHEGAGKWTVDDPAVLAVSAEGEVSALKEGYGVAALTDSKGRIKVRVEVQVGESPVPDAVSGIIARGIEEWRRGGGEAFPKYNQYSKWYNEKAKNGFGWCGAFVGYLYAEAGVDMPREFKKKDVTPISHDTLFAVRQASQTKLFEGFESYDRLTHIPRPGYYIIYGRKGSTPYTHIGLVTGVQYLGEGQYALETVEGNLNSRIKRYGYLYDSLAKPERNIKPLPQHMQTSPGELHYLYVDSFYITAFGQTWR